ncbi:MAG: hypothetical protein PHS93_07695 [Candidatus Omnitrophica bacterium]|nr:hypothetical protein [Candidatus Omnitrophota bacterium]
MAKVHGKGGAVSYKSKTTGFTSWSLDDGIDTEDTTDFADGANSIHGFTTGLYNYTATCEGMWDAANVAIVAGSSATLTLTIASGKTYTATGVICKSIKPKVAADSSVRVTYEFIPGVALTRPS